ATDTKVVYFHHLDLAFRVDHEGAAQGEAFFLDQHTEVLGNATGRIGDHREADLLDGRRVVMPRLVREVRVGGDRIDFHAQLLEFFVVVRQILKLRRADEGEVGGVEEDHAPLALEVRFGDGHVLAVVVGSGLEGLDLAVDQCAHCCAPLSRVVAFWAGSYVEGNTRYSRPIGKIVWLDGIDRQRLSFTGGGFSE